MTKYVIDLPNNTHHIKGFTTFGFNSERELFNIPRTMLEQYRVKETKDDNDDK